MKIKALYIDQIEKAKTLFDMAAICYEMLEKNISNSSVFVSEYLDESDDKAKSNPNIYSLRTFSDCVWNELNNYTEIFFNSSKSNIINMLRTFTLKSYLDNKKNQLSVIFTLLSTIDSMVSDWNSLHIIDSTSLNTEKNSSSYLVYFSARKKIHDEIIAEIGRNQKRNGDFGDEFTNLIFIEKSSLPKGAQAPEISILPYVKKSESKCLKVAIVPGVVGGHFKVENSVGSSRKIQYIPENQNAIANTLSAKMINAIECGAELIVFPEFSASKYIVDCMKEKLKAYDKTSTKQNSLIAVFLGSTWVESPNGNSNNIEFILDAHGRTVGIYYKNSPYCKPNKSSSGYKACEKLSTPGYRTSLIYVEGIGYILPAICRDVIDGKYTSYLVSRFHPSIIITPAWSTSGRSFERPLKEFSANYFSNSFLCNGCGALSPNASIIGGTVMLGKHGTVAAGQFLPISRPKSEENKCKKECTQLCGYLIQLNFTPTHINSEDRILIKPF